MSPVKGLGLICMACNATWTVKTSTKATTDEGQADRPILDTGMADMREGVVRLGTHTITMVGCATPLTLPPTNSENEQMKAPTNETFSDL